MDSLVRQFLMGSSSSRLTDPYFEYTTLLLPGNGTNGAQNNTFLDSSSNNFTITRNGNTTQGTFSPFSQTGWGNYFDGSGDYLTSPSSSAYLPSTTTTPFTLECWVYNTGTSTTTLYSALALVNYGFVLGFGSATGTYDSTATPWFGYFSGSWSGIRSTVSIPINAWTHIACVFTGSTCLIFQDGVQTASGGPSTWPSFAASVLRIGCRPDAINTFTGYISNVRIVVGTAVYTSAFTPPTAPLTAISGTSLLTCQSNRFIDNSSNNFTITRNGDTRVVAFSPFAPVAYDPAVHGGSAYFDGSGDYITSTNATAFVQGTGNFTAECWVYPVANGTTGSYGRPMIFGTVAGSQAGWSVLWEQPPYGAQSGLSTLGTESGGWASGSVTSAAGVAPIGAWTHVALVRNGANLTLYANGVSVATRSDAGSYNFPNGLNNEFRLGYFSDGSNTGSFNGYISNFRLVKGTAVYTAAFTPPTAPLTNITNTSLLLNFTNAGIYDATSKNDLETVGNAQISTAISAKWGSGSMAFDGTGDYLQAPYQTLSADFGTGQFTIELWVYFSSSVSTTQMFVSSNYNATTGAGGWAFLRRGDNNTITFTQGSNVAYGKTWSPSLNTWYHCAVTRDSSNNLRMFVDGTQVGSTDASVTASINGATSLLIGTNQFTPYPLTGYIQDLRITRGYARYTSNFTPPTAAFPTL